MAYTDSIGELIAQVGATAEAAGTLDTEEGSLDSRVTALEPVAGLVALVAAGLGASAAYSKTTDGVQTLITFSGEDNWPCIVVGVCTESFADGDTGTKPTFKVGIPGGGGGDEIIWPTSKFASATAGQVFVTAAIAAASSVIVTAEAATNDGAGAMAFTILSFPPSS
jgi:hypothetical protein